MKVAKQCAYCGRVYNVLPAVLVTPLYRVIAIDTPRPLAEITDGPKRDHHTLAGFRLALKWWTFHLGWEVHYG